MDDLTSTPTVEFCEKLELTKNTKGWNWVIGLKTKGDERVDSAMIKRLEELNIEMMQKFGGQE